MPVFLFIEFFTNANTMVYMQSLQSALLILALSRPDLVTVAENEGTLTDNDIFLINEGRLIFEGVALEPCGLEGVKHLLGFLYDDYAKERAQKGGQPGSFRSDLMRRINRTVNDFYANHGPMPSVEKIIVEQTELLRLITWGDIFKSVHPEVTLPVFIEEMTLWESLDTRLYEKGGDPDYGVAINPYNTGLAEGVVNDIFYLGNAVIRDRAPQFMEGYRAPPDESFSIQSTTATPEESERLLTTAAPGLRIFYEKFVQKDGTILIPEKEFEAMVRYQTVGLMEGSADDSPVFVVDRDTLETYDYYTTPEKAAAMFFCRNLLVQYQDGILFRQASLALSVAASALSRSPEDGAWLNIRFFDTMPGMDDFLAMLLNWMETIKESLASIVDTILKYIEFIEARIVELQQLIRRINSLIQSILGFAFQIPQSSALALTSKGTAGLLGDFISADNKPSDSPLAYGGGIAIVIPAGPVLAMDLLKELLNVTPGEIPTPGGTMSDGATISDAINAEELPSPPPLPPDPPPDVL